ncbi:MAG TPA: helix-turn-helix domain-containing protein [Solirubrobacterales bacterium]|nr:helix-turn-helix domain-containing protein [Solirubrobacterales bacterium]
MKEANGGRGRNRRVRRKGRPGKRTAKAEQPRPRRRPTRRRSRAILVKAMAHPLRRRLLREISEEGAPLSPAQLAKTFDLPLGVVAYHATVLQRCGAVEAAAAEDG